MKKNLLISIKLTLVLVVITGGVYPLLVSVIGKAATNGGQGEQLTVNGKVVGYALVGQKFTEEKYFWGRPSAVDYNAAGSAGSNKGPSNPDYLATVQARIDTFLVHNPGIVKEQIPSDLVTASGSGLDPHISPQAAKVQAARIAKARNIDIEKINQLIDQHIEGPAMGLFGPSKVHVLRLNIDLDKLTERRE